MVSKKPLFWDEAQIEIENFQKEISQRVEKSLKELSKLKLLQDSILQLSKRLRSRIQV